jgi:phenylalanyl-tRNA synthetase beta chain
MRAIKLGPQREVDSKSMKVPLSWLRDYVDVNLSVRELAERLTLAGLEVIGYRFLGLPIPEGVHVKVEERGPVWLRDKIVVAEVLKVEQHPNADRLKLVTVNYGAAAPKMVVTGAPNINVGDAGQKVILGLSGSLYFDGHVQPKQIKELKPGNLRGVASDAMVMSEFELGITDEHEGIILLEADAPVGKPLADFMGDVVLEVDVLPNMARCLSMIGIAREVAALTRQPLKRPDLGYASAADSIVDRVKVSIADPKLSARYLAKLIRGVKIGPSPGWMQRRLAYSGMRPISNIVDITNFVMLEWGQPLHAFDYDVLVQRAGGKAPHIIVRPAKAGERLKTLDGQDRELNPEILVIADEKGPIALAGVMGGLETEVTDRTTNVLLEAANFDFVSIRRAMRSLNLPSEASVRFSKGIHPAIVAPAAERAAQLMSRHAGGSVAAGAVDCYPAPLSPKVIDLEYAEIVRLLGIDFPADEVQRILTALEFKVEKRQRGIRATAPENRVDLESGAADLIEDLARIYGYDRLPAAPLAAPLPKQRGNRPLQLEEQVRDLLSGAGMQEAITYSLTTPDRETALTGGKGEYVTLQNPINADRVVMRHSVLAGLLEVLAENLKHAASVRLYEIGPVYLPKAGEKLPEEPRRLAIALTGPRRGSYWADATAGASPEMDFLDLKGVIESLLEGLHVAGVGYARSSVAWLHPGKACEIQIGGVAAGSFGELHPRTAPAFGKELTGKSVLVAELDLEAILSAVPERYRYVPVPQYAPVLRDIAVVVEESTPADRVVAEVRAGGGDMLRGATLFDVYRGESIPQGTKSLAYSLIYQADRVLTDKEIDKVHKKIEDRLKHVLKASIRGK